MPSVVCKQCCEAIPADEEAARVEWITRTFELANPALSLETIARRVKPLVPNLPDVMRKKWCRTQDELNAAYTTSLIRR
jgi:hypothetical protein